MTKKLTSTLLRLAATTILGIVLASCGGDDKGGDGPKICKFDTAITTLDKCNFSP